MDGVIEHRASNWVASLRGFLGKKSGPVEFCEVCHAEIDDEHGHLLELQSRRLVCACSGCSVLFASREARRYRRVPRDVTRMYDFNLSDAQWDGFLIPINLAFLLRTSPEGRVRAMYPGPAGATESKLELEAWDDLAETNPVLKELEEDVEALLVNRIEGARECYRVPIDRCYRLVGQIRRHWHGPSGGEGVRETIRDFFLGLREETRGLGASSDA